jgi:hypothetical protein
VRGASEERAGGEEGNESEVEVEVEGREDVSHEGLKNESLRDCFEVGGDAYWMRGVGSVSESEGLVDVPPGAVAVGRTWWGGSRGREAEEEKGEAKKACVLLLFEESGEWSLGLEERVDAVEAVVKMLRCDEWAEEREE